MNREIKFRAWDGNVMIYLTNSGLQYFDFEGSYSLGFTVDGYNSFWAHEQYKRATELAKSFPIMQFTGLHDKNGKEIYEGHILLMPDEERDYGPYEHFNHILPVVFQNGAFGVVVKESRGLMGSGGFMSFDRIAYDMGDTYIPEECEIIGNIYENPELL